jgi:hypothetical protein
LKNWLGSEPPLPQAVFYIVLVAGAALIWVLVRKELGGAQMMRRR